MSSGRLGEIPAPKTIAFMTRCHPLRKEKLEICKASIARQTCNDYEHVLIPDPTEEGCGRLRANQLFSTFEGNPKINSRYLMVLDDDDMLICDEFVETLKAITDKQSYDVVIFKGYVGRVLPLPERWKKSIKVGGIASFCMAVKKDIWYKHIDKFGTKARCGDFEFMEAVYEDAKSIYWLDMKVARIQRGAP